MTEPFKPVGVTFLRAMAPYQAGDVVGLLHERAHDLVQRRIADFYPPTAGHRRIDAAGSVEPDLLDVMDRKELVAFGKEHLGMTDEPPLTITDDALREAIRANVDPALLNAEPATEEEAGESEQDETGKQGKGGKPKP